MKWLSIFFLLFSSLQAKIIEISRIETLLHYVNETSCVLFSLDDTLLEGENQLGRLEWHDQEIAKRQTVYKSFKEAKEAFYPEWILSQMICPVRTPEKQTAFFVAKVQEIAHSASIITDRLPSIGALSVEQLQKLHIDFSKSAPVNVQVPSHDLFRNGVYFLGAGSSQIEAISSIVASHSIPVKRLIIIDKHLESLEKLESFFSTTTSFSFVGLHYTKTGERPFCEKVAALQYRALPDLISDTYAMRLLQQETNCFSQLSVSSLTAPFREGR